MRLPANVLFCRHVPGCPGLATRPDFKRELCQSVCSSAICRIRRPRPTCESTCRASACRASRPARRPRNRPPSRVRLRGLRGSRGRRGGDPAVRPAAVQGTAARRQRGPAPRGPVRAASRRARRLQQPAARWPASGRRPAPGGFGGPPRRGGSRRAPTGRRRWPESRNFGPDAPPKNKRKPPRKDGDRGPKGRSRSVRSAVSTTTTRTGARKTRSRASRSTTSPRAQKTTTGTTLQRPERRKTRPTTTRTRTGAHLLSCALARWTHTSRYLARSTGPSAPCRCWPRCSSSSPLAGRPASSGRRRTPATPLSPFRSSGSRDWRWPWCCSCSHSPASPRAGASYKPWSRVLGIVLSVLNLLNFPIGTVLGIYGLWVLLNKDTERLFTRTGLTPTV